jgi:hypothetical protein
MNYMLCRHRVRNFDYWKGVFDSHAEAHRAAGLKLVHVWHQVDDPGQVFFLFEAEDIERARAFLNSSDATALARNSGLIEGDVYLFNRSLGYGLPDESADASGSATSTKEPNSASGAKAENRSEPMRSPAPSEPVNAAPQAKSAIPSPTMKGPERVNSPPPHEHVDGWEPVENWPPAEAAAEATHEASPRRGRWMRSKY